MEVRLICDACGQAATSAMFYRGRGEHGCKGCGGNLSLADPSQERRTGIERRQTDARTPGDADWRRGEDRRKSLR